MSGLQWLFIIGSGAAGYFAVSFLIERSRRSQSAPISEKLQNPAAQHPTHVDAANKPSLSAWDEFQGKDSGERK